MLLLGLRARDSGFSMMMHGRQPRLWPGPDGSGGLAALEHRWQALWSHQCARLRVQARSGRRRVEAASPAVPAAAAGAVTTGRVHPLERAAATAQQRGQRSEAFADSHDALLACVAALRLRRPDRVTQHFGWRLLHVALRCGAATVTWCRAAGLQELQDAVCCSAVQCAGAGLGDGQLESWSQPTFSCTARWCSRRLHGS